MCFFVPIFLQKHIFDWTTVESIIKCYRDSQNFRPFSFPFLCDNTNKSDVSICWLQMSIVNVHDERWSRGSHRADLWSEDEAVHILQVPLRRESFHSEDIQRIKYTAGQRKPLGYFKVFIQNKTLHKVCLQVEFCKHGHLRSLIFIPIIPGTFQGWKYYF